MKFLVEKSPIDWVRLFGLPEGIIEPADTDLSTVTTAADRAFLVRAIIDYIAHVEFIAGEDFVFDPKFLQYAVLYAVRYGIPVESMAIFLRPVARHHRHTGYFALPGVDGTPRIEFHYRVLRVWQEPAETFLNGGLTLLPLAPIAKVARKDVPKVLAQVEKRLSEEAAPGDLATLTTATGILLGLKYPRSFIESLMRRDEMKNSTFYQSIVEEGVEKGRVEGRIEGAHETLLRQGRRRFGEPNTATVEHILSETSLERLNDLLDRILAVESWEELVREQSGQ
jgi:predicted transposase YdaD